MKLIDLIEELNEVMDDDVCIDGGYILDVADDMVTESIIEELNTLTEANARNIATTTGEDLVIVKSIITLRKKAAAIIKAGQSKNPLKTAPLIAKVRYLTGAGKGKAKNLAKGIIKGGVPKEDPVYNTNKADIAAIEANKEAGTSKKTELKKDQIRYKKSNRVGDYRILSLRNLFAIKIKNKVYTIATAEAKVTQYAEDASKAVVKSRTLAAKIAKAFNLKTPFIPSSEEEAKKYIIDVLIRPTSKNALAQRKRRQDMEDRKNAADASGDKLPKDDYVIITEGYRKGKVYIMVQYPIDKMVASEGYGSFKALVPPTDWTDTKAAWGRQFKTNKAALKEKIEGLAGSNALVSLGNIGGWVTVRFAN